MIWKVDPSDAVPVYAQIVEQVKHATTSGVLRPGDYLPSLRDTARTLRVNPNTVVKAYRELEVLGIVRTDHGRGTVITASATLPDEQRQARLDDLADRLLVEAYHLGATPKEVSDALARRLEAMRPQFTRRDERPSVSPAPKEDGHEQS